MVANQSNSKRSSLSEILNGYVDADEYCVINEDESALHPIHIKLPEPPPTETIDGYGLSKYDQKFTKQVMPKKLAELVNSFDTIDQIWDELEENGQEYIEEIRWIKLQWYRRFNGYWFFCFGKPTYINGWNYCYLNFWSFMDNAVLEYRDRNRKFFHAMWYAYTTTETLVYEDKSIVYEDQITKRAKMEDIGIRTFHGITYPKNRRDGATNMVECAKFLETTIKSGVASGLVSSDGKHAKKLYAEISVVGWKGMPFFFKPVHSGFDNPEDAMKFFAPKKKGQLARGQRQLGSIINFSETAQPTFYDGSKLLWLNCEEAGKTTECDVVWRHDVLKRTIGEGSGINGFMTYPSTVGEMTAKGGNNFFRLCEQSHWERRTQNRRTTSGLMNIYFSSVEGLNKNIDPWGFSVIDEPTKEQVLFAKKEIVWKDKYHYAVNGFGARQYLQNNRQSKLDADDMEGYNEEVRLFPITYAECFRSSDGEVGFNTKKLGDRIDILKFTKKKETRIGNFKWENDVRDGKVIWEDDPDRGRFLLSKILPENESNMKYRDGETWFPVNPKFTASADTYEFGKKKTGGMSDGGGAVFWDFDVHIDGNRDINYWVTNRIVCTYRQRPPELDDFCEDMLMMCVYFGAMMYPEQNKRYIWKHFDDRGYGGFMKYDIDIKNNQFKDVPGFTSLTGSKQDLFNSVRDYIEKHAHRCLHMDFLEECQKISGIDDMTHWDLFTAGAAAIMGAKSKHAKIISINTEKVNISDYAEKFTYT